MNRSRLALRLALALAFAVLGALPALAVRRTEDPLALVPASAATVGVVHWNALRASPLAAKVFADVDRMSGDGDAARFLADTGLTPREDIDTVIIAMSPGSAPGEAEAGLVIFEGRFDLNRITAALTSRGGKRQDSANGVFYRLAQSAGTADSQEPGAVALVNRNLLVCGNENAVVAALARKESGGEGGLTSGQGIGRHLGRVDRDASAWALVDLTRLPSARRAAGNAGEPSQALMGAMKSVSLLAVSAVVHGDSVDLSAAGLSSDAENRNLIADSLRGMLAMWRLAVADKSPDLVSVLRRFEIDSDGDSVSIRGTLPGSFLRSLSENRHAAR
ncbi:MAG: hypothetical protein ABI968_00890 [Acidobacteriota bacterium]